MKKLVDKIISRISAAGDGMEEFDTRDIEQLVNRVEKLERERMSMLKWLSSQGFGAHYHRIQENEDHADDGWNNSEKSFCQEWRKFEPEHLTTLLHSRKTGVTIKPTMKVRVACATVIQWLGTNVGWAFLETVLKAEGYRIVKIEKNEAIN